MDIKKRNLILLVLRRGTYKWPPRNQALKDAKAGRNQYRCALCPPTKLYANKDKELDHVNPVQRVDAVWDGLENVADRLYGDKGQWQVLCKPHHKEKSARENTLRAEARRQIKSKQKTGKRK